MTRRRAGAFAIAAGLGLACGAIAQGYPTRTIRIIVPQAAGGGSDTVARLLAAERRGASRSSSKTGSVRVASSVRRWPRAPHPMATRFGINGMLATYPHLRSGRLRILAVASRARHPAVPDVPTISETLLGSESGSWQGEAMRATAAPGATQRIPCGGDAMNRTKSALHLVGALVVAGCAASAPAQETYPSKPVRMIIPFPPGGSNDIVGRMVAAQLSDRLGRQVVVDNRGGAGGVVGADLAAKATPDGHTLRIISVAYVFDTWLYKLPYDPISLGSLNQSLPHIRSGRLRALGTGGPKRTSILPDVPTIAEAGLPGCEATNWWGLLTTAGRPAPIVERLRKELSTVLTSAESQKRMQSEGSEVLQMEPARFSRFIETETAKWGRVVKEAGIKGE